MVTVPSSTLANLIAGLSWQTQQWSGMPLSFFSSEAAALVAVVGVVVSMLIFLEALDQLFLAHMTCAITTLFFLSLNLIWMYIFFEMSLIPVVLILASFGGQPEKTGAYLYLLCYSILSSFPMLLFFLSGDSEETDSTSTLSGVWAFCMTVMFLVKLPLYGLHMWLPKAHVEAPTTGSILLAGLLLKMGGWGLFRLASCGLGLLRSGVFLLGIAGMGMGGLLASFQTDSKSLVAYSSVGHMNFFCVILVDETTYGKGVSILMMFAHSLVSSLMFFLAGFLAHIICTRSMYYAGAMPVISMTMSLVMLVAVFANFGTPPSMSFFAEVGFLASILGSFPNAWLMMMAAFFLGCYFSIYFYLSLSSDNRLGGSRSSHNESLTLIVLLWIISIWWSRGLI